MNKNIFCFTIIVIIIILSDLVFNFSKPLFRVSEGFEGKLDDNNKMMIIRSAFGHIIRIHIEKKNTDEDEYYILVNDKDNNVLGLDKYNDLVIKPKSHEQSWTLREFGTNDSVLDKVFENTIIDDDDKTEINTKGRYILTKQANNNKHYALFFDYNRLTSISLDLAVPYNNIINIGDISTDTPPKHELLYREFKNSYLGPVKYSNEIGDPDKINIKLNIQDENLKQLLNINGGGASTDSNTDGEAEKCDTWLSKDAVRSLCPGCVN